MTRSVAALIGGYQGFEPDTPICGVILNNIAGPRHEAKLVRAVERHCQVPVVGTIPRDGSLRITERHLGLIPFQESGPGSPGMDGILKAIEGNLHLDTIVDIARKAPAYRAKAQVEKAPEGVKARIGILSDKAFTFYYPENLEALTRCGADIVSINSFIDRRLPDIEALYIGGGFPEVYAEELSRNESLLADIAFHVEAGLPTYAECAGLMYLARGIRMDGNFYPMVGVIRSEVEFLRRPVGHGYVEAEVTAGNPYFPIGRILKGHEFHHSRLRDPQGLTLSYSISRGHGVDGRHDGITYKNLVASYMHLHALSNPEWAEAFVRCAVARERCPSKPSDLFIRGGRNG
jgi:cobyrinic acid a,c-diamide synthase